MPNSTMDDIEFEKFAGVDGRSLGWKVRTCCAATAFTDDINLDGANFRQHVLRSPFAHGHIRKLDVSATGAADGVLCVLTAKNWPRRG